MVLIIRDSGLREAVIVNAFRNGEIKFLGYALCVF